MTGPIETESHDSNLTIESTEYWYDNGTVHLLLVFFFNADRFRGFGGFSGSKKPNGQNDGNHSYRLHSCIYNGVYHI